MNIIGIITTKNRYEYFEKAFRSAITQTRKPDNLIVVSDSESSLKEKEKRLVEGVSAIFLDDKYTHNYAGSLNTAIHYILADALSKRVDYEKTYVAFLDDDDTWDEDYIRECENSLSDEDFVVCGLRYYNEKGVQLLTIPHQLSIESFLRGNPHLQGSNTFVKLSTLLKAGLFDENMSSTTDRDIFTRIMLLNPTYVVVERHLVNIDAFNFRERITNGKDKKADGLRKFFYKYGGYMSDEVKEAFFSRAENIFGIDRKIICGFSRTNNIERRHYNKEKYTGQLTIGFIATEYSLGLRLLKELTNLKRKNTKIVVLINFIQDRKAYLEILENSGYSYDIVDRESVIRKIREGGFDQFVTEDKIADSVIKDIAVARTILQNYLYQCTCEGDVIWILDEDMRLYELIYEDKGLHEEPLNIDAVIGEYIGKYDAVIGNYALDAPLPLLATLRTSLLDYVYSKAGVCGECTLDSLKDYYYDFSDSMTKHLETPVKISKEYSLDDVFSGKTLSRPLFVYDFTLKEAVCRGGNTIVFNRDLLKIPNWSIQIGDKIGRRSDYFWVLLAKKEGYDIVNAPFATLHDRTAVKFDFEKEKNKLLLDFIGASFTKAVEDAGFNVSKGNFYKIFKHFFISRLIRFIACFYRIQGLLEILKDEKYAVYFTERELHDYLKEIQPYIEEEKIECAYDDICDKLQIQRNMKLKDIIRKEIAEYFGLDENSLRLLGSGKEGMAFTDNIYVFKYFFRPLKNLSFLKSIATKFKKCKQLYPLEFFDLNNTTVIRYTYEHSVGYEKGYVGDIVELLRFSIENGFDFDNYKKENFIVTNNGIKLVDYGRSFLPATKKGCEKSIIRAYEMLRYPFLSEIEFKILIQRYYNGMTQYIDDGKQNLYNLVKRRYKEDIHDDKVLDIIKRENPSRILDYGAGKCKIANALSKDYDVSVYDIDKAILKKRAVSNVKIVEDRTRLRKGEYDLVISNLVLCCVQDDVALEIMCDINKVLTKSGKVVVSICNPLFNSVQHTELRTSGIEGEYRRSEHYKKMTTVGNTVRDEFHRPIEFYQNLLSRCGFQIESVAEGDGVDVDTLMPISEHLIFVCKKTTDLKEYRDCTLLIKTNPMEWDTIYNDIRHIVNSLEKFGRFKRRTIVADLSVVEDRARRYNVDDKDKLIKELLLAEENRLIDEVLFAEENSVEIERIYNKYFGVKSNNGHSANGQGIYATLFAFDHIKTKYVFQTDSDILYYIDKDVVQEGIDSLRSGAVTTSLGIARNISKTIAKGARTEVRSCFLDLEKIKKRLPLPNSVDKGQVQLPWHRSLDLMIEKKESVRFADSNAWFVHPENQRKSEMNFLTVVTERVESGFFCADQEEQVNLRGERSEWVEKTQADVVLFIRGYNTPCEKLKRLFDSLKKQTFQNFDIVYIDDASSNESAEYARLILRKDLYFKNRTAACWNKANVGGLENFVFAMQNMIINKNAIVINIDNDDYLVNERAVELIVKKFNEGAEITCGNCIRWDKPLKKYSIFSFDKVWERGGDNIWLHPKCFRRYLFDCIDIENDLKIDGKYLDVNTDFAFMLPMIQKADRKAFIEDVLYYFEPSLENCERKGKYRDEYKSKVKKILLEKSERRNYEKK